MVKIKRLIALDTEDDSNGNVTIINFFDGLEHTTFTGYGMRAKAWTWLESQGAAMVWACNLEYDLVNVFGPQWLGKLCTLQYVSAGLMRATMTTAPGLMFFDTLRHWAMTVEQMGKYIGLPKMKRNFRSVRYCRRDTEVVWTFVREMLKRYGRIGLTNTRATLPAMAMQLYREQFCEHELSVPHALSEWFRAGYYGGRVEVYRLGVVKGRIRNYDVNSLFPFVMSRQEFPDLSRWSFVGKHPHFNRFGMLQGRIDVPRVWLPPLPMRSTDETLYPVGVCDGVWTYPEIRQVIRDGGRVLRVDKAVEFPRGCRPFTRFVDYCYKERLAATHDLDKVFWKLMMNSLYGKFAAHDGLFMIHNNREVTLETHAETANVIWSAYITAYARLHMLGVLRASRPVFYTDTDSLFTTNRRVVSRALGGLKLEGEYQRCRFIGNKLYVAGTRIKAKGVPNRDGALKQFVTTGRAIFKAPVRFRESRRRVGVVANQWVKHKKTIRTEYTKRRVLPDGNTEPWNWLDYQRIMDT